jgi:hypothetical protein
LCIDACKEIIGGVLTKNRHAIFYKSRKHEINYSTHDLVLVSIVHVLNMWRHYLMVRKFELRNYHSVLKYLFE